MGASLGSDVNCCQRSLVKAPFNGLEIIVEDYTADGIKAMVAAHLSRGQPVLFPLPSPLPYIVVAADPVMVNLAKGRPADEPVSRLISSLAEIEHILAFETEEAKELARMHLQDERMRVLLPVEKKKEVLLAAASHMLLHVIEEDEDDEDEDDKSFSVQSSEDTKNDYDASAGSLAPSAFLRSESLAADLLAHRDNPDLLFGQFLQVDHLGELCSQERPLYGSWANAHQQSFAQCFSLVCKQFRTVQAPYTLLALDADSLRDEDCHHAPPSTIRINPDGTWKFLREGINKGDLYGRKTRIWLTDNETDAWIMR